MSQSVRTVASIIVSATAIFLGQIEISGAQPADGPPPFHGGDHPKDERLGDTSILIGQTPIPHRSKPVERNRDIRALFVLLIF